MKRAGDGHPVHVRVGGRELTLRNLDKVMYPATGFTKRDLIDYYGRIAAVAVPHYAGRCMTLKRYPDGVEGASFFEKRCPKHAPAWIPRAVGPGDRNGVIHYCVFDEEAALVWAGNMAAIELHAPMALASDLDTPTMLVFDLDPGPPAAMRECCRVGLAVKAVLDAVGLQAVAKTSGSKGLQVYVPLNTPGATHQRAADVALAVGTLLAKQQPDEVVTTMTRSLRPGKVFVDWSQNARFKTTVAVYSLRARERPTVSTPVSWDEVSDGADGRDDLRFEAADVLDRVARLGDLFAPALTVRQELPGG